jgi:energy-coupling factor transport system permease protein
MVMLGKLFYQEKGTFLQSLHPVAVLLYLVALLLTALLFSHPLYLSGVLLIAVLAIISSDALENWEMYLKISLPMILLIALVNPLVAHAGKTILWYGPQIPFLGRFTISLEAVCYGFAMGVRLLAVLSIFCLYNAVVHPDRVLHLFSRFAYKSALVVSLATRMLPQMNRELKNIQDVQKVRGVDFESKSFKERVKNYFRLVNILLLSSLEGALQIAEAMQSRAFGSGPRSFYRREPVKPRDIICLASSGLALIAAIFAKIKGAGDYTYYPQLGYLIEDFRSLIVLSVILIGAFVPVGLSWGWNCCPYLRSKI